MGAPVGRMISLHNTLGDQIIATTIVSKVIHIYYNFHSFTQFDIGII